MRLWVKNNLVAIVCAVASFLLGIAVHHAYDLNNNHRGRDVVQLRENSSKYKYINPLILVADNRNIEYEEYTSLRSLAGKFIEDSYHQNKVSKVGFYFRDLNSGEWVGVNEEEKFAPASMLKVTTLIALLKIASDDPSILLKEVYYEPNDVGGQYYKPSQIASGNYTIKELIQQMIVESDNDAMRLLNKFSPEEIGKIYNSLELLDLFSEESDFMSPRLFSRLFRTLYNGTYISDFYSDEALGLLTLTKFDRGIIAGVEPGTVVAHKFGEWNEEVGGIIKKRELHDCGIVYYPQKPYFICIMTKGREFSDMEKVIESLSRITYQYIESAH